MFQASFMFKKTQTKHSNAQKAPEELSILQGIIDSKDTCKSHMQRDHCIWAFVLFAVVVILLFVSASGWMVAHLNP